METGGGPRPNPRTVRTIGGILVVGAILVAMVLVWGPGGSAAPGEPGLLDYPRGPHGARLLSDGALQVEMTIYEDGVPPHFRVYPLDADLEPIPPGEVELQVELHRLGGRIDRFTFRPEGDYLIGDGVVEEPHSFDVKVTAVRGGQRHAWEYAQIEGKVQLAAEQLASAGIVIDSVGPRMMVTTVALPGEVKADETRLAHVVPRLSGVVVAVLAKEGDRVRQDQVLAVLSSRELADAKSAYLAAARHVEFTRVALAREESLWQKQISAERELLEARRVFHEAELAASLAGQNLMVLGLTRAELDGLPSAPAESLPRYEIRSPLGGEVTERNVTVGEAVAADEDIFTVADLSTIWIDVTVYAKDLGKVRPNQVATVRSPDLGIEAPGRVTYLGPLVGQDTRAAIARIVLPNPGGRWRPGLFVAVELVDEEAMVPLAVPLDAIQTFRDWQVVFFRYGDWFEARPLELGRSDGRWVEVRAGLARGDRYAAVNSFAVKAEIGKLGASHDH